MSEPILFIGKLVVLALLYVFLGRAVRTVALDLGTATRKPTAPPRPETASPDRSPGRAAPEELVVHVPGARPRVVALNGQSLVLGRDHAAGVHIDDRYVSDEHAEITPDGQRWLVRDLGSTNGTFINEAKVTQPTPISPGDQLRLGKTRIEVRR